MIVPDASLPPGDPRCRLTVAIPAKNEERCIATALDAFAGQRESDGRPVDPRSFEVLVLANDCSDATAEVVRRFAADNTGLRVLLVACALPSDSAHVGAARRIALDLALDRRLATRGPVGALASTDADSVVDRLWIARTLIALESADAVAGHVELAVSERDGLEAGARALYDRERAYRRALGEMEAVFDPRPFDPPRRHDSFVGASFAVRAKTYVAAGRLPVLSRLEDVAFARALRDIDASIRHSYDVTVATSARSLARVDGGFASFVDDLRERGKRRDSFLVESARRSIARADARAALRSFWNSGADAVAANVAAHVYGVLAATLGELVDPFAPFGESLARVEAAGAWFEALPDEPVEDAVATLRAAVAIANARSATRMSAASGAG